MVKKAVERFGRPAQSGRPVTIAVITTPWMLSPAGEKAPAFNLAQFFLLIKLVRAGKLCDIRGN